MENKPLSQVRPDPIRAARETPGRETTLCVMENLYDVAFDADSW